MKLLENIMLAEYTTIKIGGIAEVMYIPETVEELKQVIRDHHPTYFIGGGSNLLISDKHSFEKVVNLREFNKDIQNLGNGQYIVGASVRLQELISTINADGFGGIEYLYSVPGLVGGAVVMNAGGGKSEGNCISDYITFVNVLEDGEIKCLAKENCCFSYRESLFKLENRFIVISAVFCFKRQTMEESRKKISDRLELTRKIHDISKPNFGSVFKKFDPRIMYFIKRTQRKRKKGVFYSKKTQNWLVNYGKGSFAQAIKRIKFVKRLHKIARQDCETEVIIWE